MPGFEKSTALNLIQQKPASHAGFPARYAACLFSFLRLFSKIHMSILPTMQLSFSPHSVSLAIVTSLAGMVFKALITTSKGWLCFLSRQFNARGTYRFL